mgnify:CR=1 FL=1
MSIIFGIQYSIHIQFPNILGQAGVRVRETGVDHASVELSRPRKSDQPDVIDDVLIESLKVRMRNQIAPGHSEVLRLLETRGA